MIPNPSNGQANMISSQLDEKMFQTVDQKVEKVDYNFFEKNAILDQQKALA